MKNNIVRRTALIVACVAFAIIFILYASRLFQKTEYNVSPIQNWNTPSGSETFELPQTLKWDNDGKCEIFTTLPDTLRTADEYICFWTYLSSVEVLVEDEVVYHYNNSATESFGKASTSQWNFLKLPSDAAGKRLTILLESPYTDTQPHIAEVMLGDLHDLHHWQNQRYYVARFLDDSMFWVGAFLILFGIIKKSSKKYHVWIGLFLILFSCYLRTATKSVPLEGITPFAKDFLCYFSMFTLSLPFTLYTHSRVERNFKRIWCEILLYLEIAATVICFLLHFFGVVDIHYTLSIGIGILFFALISAIYFAINYYLKKRAKGALVSLISPLTLLVVFAAEYIKFYFVGFLPFSTGLLSRLAAIVILFLESQVFIRGIIKESKKQEEIENEHRNLKLQMLTENIRPHFILNTIGAIRTLIPKDPERASNLMLDFSKYIRDRIDQKDYYTPVPFLEELDNIQTYLSLEKARFGDTIEVFYNCTDTQFRILPLTVQPFVENSIKHGLFTVKDGGKLWISTYSTPKGDHVVEITDNGVGFEANQIEEAMNNKKAVGMRSAVMRLESLMKANISIYSNSETGTNVKIQIPKAGE